MARCGRLVGFLFRPHRPLGRAEVNGEPQLITRLDGQPSEAGGLRWRFERVECQSFGAVGHHPHHRLAARHEQCFGGAVSAAAGVDAVARTGRGSCGGFVAVALEFIGRRFGVGDGCCQFPLVGRRRGGVALLALVLTAQTAKYRWYCGCWC